MFAHSFSIGCLLIATPLPAAQNPRMEYALGVLAENRGDAGKANNHFENARLLDPTAATLVQLAVSRLIDSGDRSGAIAMFREFAESRPDDLGTQLGYADFLLEQGKGDALASKLINEVLDAALLKHPGHPEIIRRLVSINPARGKELLDSLSPEDPASVLLFATLSRSIHEADDTDARAALDSRLTGALQIHPEDAVLAREASEHFRRTGRMDEAIDALKTHTAAAPWSLDLRVRLGILCFAAKRDDEGESILKELLAIHPRHALAHQSMAKFYRLRDMPDPAAMHSGELLKIRGGASSEFLTLAETHLTAGRPRDARLLLEKAVFIHPDHVALRMKLAVATHQDPETRSRAPRLFREADAVAGDEPIKDPVFLSTSAEALIESGQIKAGEERLRAAIRSHPPEAKKETAASLRRLAALWTAENRDPAEVRSLLKRADSLDPP